MGVNGVSHHLVNDDLEGVSQVLQWLSFTPAIIGGTPPLLPSRDSINRSIAYSPEPGMHPCYHAHAAGQIAACAAGPDCRSGD